jgi:hypothetical protein
MAIARNGVFRVVVTTWIYREEVPAEELGAAQGRVAFGDFEDIYFWEEVVGLLLNLKDGLEGQLFIRILKRNIIDIAFVIINPQRLYVILYVIRKLPIVVSHYR